MVIVILVGRRHSPMLRPRLQDELRSLERHTRLCLLTRKPKHTLRRPSNHLVLSKVKLAPKVIAQLLDGAANVLTDPPLWNAVHVVDADLITLRVARLPLAVAECHQLALGLRSSHFLASAHIVIAAITAAMTSAPNAIPMRNDSRWT